MPGTVRILALVTTLCLAAGAQAAERGLPNVDSQHWSDEYDEYFRKYSKRYFGAHFDWQWFKAQAIAESNLKPGAQSPMGAMGLMQILPTTYQEIQEANPHFQDMMDPRWNIAAGIYYDRMLYRTWQKGLSEQERLLLAFASYNAGLGNIQKAYRRSPEPIHGWADIAPRAPAETRGYVARIRHLKNRQDEDRPRYRKGLWAKLFARKEE